MVRYACISRCSGTTASFEGYSFLSLLFAHLVMLSLMMMMQILIDGKEWDIAFQADVYEN